MSYTPHGSLGLSDDLKKQETRRKQQGVGEPLAGTADNAMSNEQRVEAIRSAAVDFANDYGPLAEANRGDEVARHAVAHNLWRALRKRGLSIVPGEV